MNIVNLRVGGNAGPIEGSIEEPMNVLAELKSRGLVRHLGVSKSLRSSSPKRREFRRLFAFRISIMWPNRHDDEFIDELAKQDIAYVSRGAD